MRTQRIPFAFQRESALEQASQTQRSAAANTPAWGHVFVVAAWLGLVTGLVEGAGLLLFQRINWARWGAVSHVSAEILWISAVVDVAFFSLIALIVALAGRYVRPLPVLRAIVFVLTVLAVHDWLALTERLSRISCWLLAVGVAAAIGRWFAVHSDTALRFWRKTLPAAVAAIFVLAVAIHA